MSQGSDVDDAVVVQGDGLTVEKRFSADEFPVPAISFALRSDRESPVEFRIVDDIPEDFPMDRVGFHPEYESEHWTAYQDHRVEYRRRLDPGEEVTTVYGIRTDDPDRGREFLSEPTVEEVAEDEDPVGDVADVIGEDSSKVVRDVLSGDRDAIPGDGAGADGDAETATGQDGTDDSPLDLAAAEDDLGLTDEDPVEASEATAGADDVAADDAPGDDDATEAGGTDEGGVPGDEAIAAAVDGAVDGDPLAADDGDATAAETADAGDAAGAEPEPVELADPLAADEGADGVDAGEDVAEEGDGAVPDEGVGAEPDEGGVDDESAGDGVATPDGADDADAGEDVSTLDRDEEVVDGEADATVAGAGAGGVAAALAAELRAGDVSEEDRELLKRELELDHSTSVDARVSRLQSTVEDLAAYTDALEAFIDDNGTADELLESLRADVTEVSDGLDAVETDVAEADEARADLSAEVSDVRDAVESVDDELTGTVEGLEASVAAVRSELDDLADEVAAEDDAIAEVRDGMAAIEDEVASLSATVDDEVGDLRGELAEVRAELEGFEQFRDRLSSVFGPGGAATGGDGGGDAE